jgi:hypothetical protein
MVCIPPEIQGLKAFLIFLNGFSKEIVTLLSESIHNITAAMIVFNRFALTASFPLAATLH